MINLLPLIDEERDEEGYVSIHKHTPVKERDITNKKTD